MTPPRHVFTMFVDAAPETVWRTLTDANEIPRWHNGMPLLSDWQPGSTVRMNDAEGRTVVEGEVLEAQAPSRLCWMFGGRWNDEVAGDPPSRISWEITPVGGLTRIVMIHDGFEGETATYRAVAGGWPSMIAALKTLLDGGEPLRSAA